MPGVGRKGMQRATVDGLQFMGFATPAAMRHEGVGSCKITGSGSVQDAKNKPRRWKEEGNLSVVMAPDGLARRVRIVSRDQLASGCNES